MRLSILGGLSVDELDQFQQRYCDTTDREYRRAAGQFFTPRWIATGLASWVVATRPKSILDPAFGLGALLQACTDLGFDGSLIAYEFDSALVQRWQAEYGQTSAVELHCADFLTCRAGVIDAAIANPPYNRFQNRDLPTPVHAELAQALGEVASGYTNQYALFLYLVVSRLSIDGRAAFIVPSEFLATGYGAQVKRFLLRTQRLRHVVLFDTATRIFPEAATTACVMLFERGLQDCLTVTHLGAEEDAAAFHALCASEAHTPGSTEISYAELDPDGNWQNLGLEQSDWTGFADLKTFGQVSRGIATGANEFFVLSASEAAARKLVLSDLVPCIASANAAPGIVFCDDHWRDLRDRDKPAYLFDGLTAPSNFASEYVHYGETQGLHRRYLTKMRRPWYRLEQRVQAPLLLAVFGRDGFRAVLNKSRALNLTAFHGFYPREGWESISEVLWMYLQTPTALRSFARQQRAYGDGLKKLEPGDWGKLKVPDWRLRSVSALRAVEQLARDGVRAWLGGDLDGLADSVSSFESWVQDRSLSSTPLSDDSRSPQGQLQLI
jgi:adenine-specific DNA-methyltransferase